MADNLPTSIKNLNTLLGEQLAEGSGSSGGGDVGYECREEYSTLTEESVTTADDGTGFIGATLTYSEPITADKIRVTFNGTEYECDAIDFNGAKYYGGFGEQGPDFSEYPFVVFSVLAPNDQPNAIGTESAGTYQVKIESPTTVVETSECFKRAVAFANTLRVSRSNNGTLTETWRTIHDALQEGKRVVLSYTPEGEYFSVVSSIDAAYVVATSSNTFTLVSNEGDMKKYVADSPDDYPIITIS